MAPPSLEFHQPGVWFAFIDSSNRMLTIPALTRTRLICRLAGSGVRSVSSFLRCMKIFGLRAYRLFSYWGLMGTLGLHTGFFAGIYAPNPVRRKPPIALVAFCEDGSVGHSICMVGSMMALGPSFSFYGQPCS